MNIRWGLIVFLFLVYSVHAWDDSKKQCKNLPEMDFDISMAYVQENQIDSDDLPSRKTNDDKELEYQDNNDDIIINVTRKIRQPWGSYDEVDSFQILDDTGLFSSYFAGISLIRADWAGQETQREIQVFENYLDKLSDTMDDFDPSFFLYNNYAQNSLERVYDIIHTQPLNSIALYQELQKMVYFSTVTDDSARIEGRYLNLAGSVRIQGYVRSKERDIDGRERYGLWRVYEGPEHWKRRSHLPSSSDELSVPDQPFVVLADRLRSDGSSTFICSREFSYHSQIIIRPFPIGDQRGILSATKRWVNDFVNSGDSDTEEITSRSSRRNVRASLSR